MITFYLHIFKRGMIPVIFKGFDMKAKTLLLGAAITGLGLMTTGCAMQSGGEMGMTGKCSGINSCKGKGACGGKTHSCAGMNKCKGKGWLKMSKDECKKKHGKFKS